MNDDLTQIVLDALAAGDSVESLAARYPAAADEIRTLAQTVQALRLAAHPPLPARAGDAQAEFMRMVGQRRVAANQRRESPARRKRWWTPVRLAWALGCLACLLALSTGTVAAAAGALPGDTLYGVKRWRENVELSLGSADAKISYHIRHSAERRREIEALAQAKRPVPAAVITDMQTETAAAMAGLEQVVTSDPRWEEFAVLVDYQDATLATLQPADQETAAAIAQTRSQNQLLRARARLIRQSPILMPPLHATPAVPPTSRPSLPSAVPATLPATALPPVTPTRLPAATASPQGAPLPSATPQPDAPTPSPAPPTATAKPAPPMPTAKPAPPKPTAKPATPKPTTRPAPTAKPTATPEPPAPEPTATPEPPAPTATSEPPTPTKTPRPEPPGQTRTPGPPDEPPGQTRTPGPPDEPPRPTKTPKPDNTPRPTHTPKPENTPKPTKTPKP